MKIGLYIRENDPISGGGYTYEKELSTALISGIGRTRHEIIPIHENRSLTEKVLFVLIHHFFPNSPMLRMCQSKLSNLGKVIRKEHIDIVIFCTPAHDPVDTPYITAVWDLNHRIQPWFPEVSSGGEWANREVWYIPVLQRAMYILVGTETGRQEISSFYNIPENRIKVIPMPVPGFAMAVERITPRADKEYLFYPAQFWPHKNHVNLLHAMKIVRDKFGIKLFLILSGSDKGNLDFVRQSITRIGCSEYVAIAGFVPQEDLIEIYQNAFALIFPTLFGPDNLPPLEAAALGCPCIVSDVSGARDQLGNAALYFDPADPESIAKSIIELYTNRDLRDKLIQEGYALAKKRTSKKTATSIFKLVDEFENTRRCWD